MNCDKWGRLPPKPWQKEGELDKTCTCRRTLYFARVERASGNSFTATVFNRLARSEENGTFRSREAAMQAADNWLQNLCRGGSPHPVSRYHTKSGRGYGCGCSRAR